MRSGRGKEREIFSTKKISALRFASEVSDSIRNYEKSPDQTVLTRTFWRWGGSLRAAAVPDDADASPAPLRRDRARHERSDQKDEIR